MYICFQTTQSTPVPEKIDVKPTGCMSAYAFFIQSCKEEHEKNHPNEKEFNFVEISKKWMEKWKVSFSHQLTLIDLFNIV